MWFATNLSCILLLFLLLLILDVFLLNAVSDEHVMFLFLLILVVLLLNAG